MSRRPTAIRTIVLLCIAAGVSKGVAQPTLKEVFRDDFHVGAAVNWWQVNGTDTASERIILRQFDSISPENLLKWSLVHPRPGTYNFGPSDAYVDFGLKNHLWIIGHNLVWHNQVPDWVFKDSEGRPVSRDTLLNRMRDHIFSVVGRYKGKINGWDVVNEAITEDGKMRKSPWYNIIGKDYVEMAFAYAHEADPNAELYYNDYNLYKPEKRKGVIRLVRRLQHDGVPVAGIGMQFHYGLSAPPLQSLEASINAFAKLGVHVMVTELDVNLLPNPSDLRKEYPDAADSTLLRMSDLYPDGLPDSVSTQLARRYADLFRLFLAHRDVISRVTFWGVYDGQSWLNRGRMNYPLLFDRSWKPKEAYDAVIGVGTRD